MLLTAPFPSMEAAPIFAAIIAKPIPAATPFRIPVSTLSFMPFVAVFPLPCPGVTMPVPAARLPLVPFLSLGARDGGHENEPTSQH
jgi:hypothetical protein